MRFWRLPAPIVVSAAALLLLAACSPSATPAPVASDPSSTPSPTATAEPDATPTATAKPARQRVVYVSDDRAIFTVNVDGTGRLRITGGGSGSGGGVRAQPLIVPRGQQSASPAYTWPTWSPDGERLAVSRSPGPTDGSIAALTLLEPPNFTETVAQETSPGLVNGVAPGTSHYASWSPNGERLGFVAPNDDGSALGLFEASFDGADTKAIMENAPLYFVWSPDSKRLLIHRQQTLLLRDEDGGTRDLRRSSFSYRVPAFSPDGAAIAYVSDIGDGEQLIVRDLADDGELALWDVGTEAAFAWSPAEASTLAAARRARPFGANYEGVVLFDTQTGERRELYGGTVLAFYWSPDGTKLALATTSAGSGRLGWTVVDVASGDATVLASFSPSRDTLIHLQFFDQFAPSHLVWSADSRFIVFAGDLIEARDRRRAPNQAWVIDTTGETDPLAIADARLALFAPLGAP